MVLVDKEIKARVAKGELISEGYRENNVKGIAYELTVDCAYDLQNKAVSSIDMAPGDVVYVKTIEQLSIPEDITARIIERNSVMRLGFKVDGPQYIPGHKTFCFLRVQNISSSVLTLDKGFGIAQVMFEQLSGIPEQTYGKQVEASFQNETEYIGTGRYKQTYARLQKDFSKVKDDIDTLKERIYGNVLTLMGIFVSIFTIISVNIQAFVKEQISARLIATINISLLSCIFVLLGFVFLIVNHSKKRWFKIVYLAITFCLLLAGIVLVFKK